MPDVLFGDFMGRSIRDYIEGFNRVSRELGGKDLFKLECTGKITDEQMQKLENSKFYLWGLFHGCDYGHHGEDNVSGLLIETTSLDKIRDQEIKEGTIFYDLLKSLEEYEAPQNNPEDNTPNPNPKYSLQEKITLVNCFKESE